MLRLASVASVTALVLGACTSSEPGERAGSGECPAGEECSDTTPFGLHFGGARLTDMSLDSPAATAVGGTQEISILEDRGGELEALNAPYIADDDGGAGVRVVEQLGAMVRVQGAGSRSNYLRIVEQSTGLLFDRYELVGAAIEEVALIDTGDELVPDDASIVWGPGQQRIGVALYGDVQHGNDRRSERLVDTSMEIALDGATATSWDQVEVSATVGTHPIVVTAGAGITRTLDLVVVGGADAISPVPGLMGELTVEAGSSSTLCMTASNTGRHVYGLTWRFEVAGEVTTHGFNALLRNCITFSANGAVGTTMPLIATAGGITKTFGIEVIASTAKAAPARALEAVSTAARAAAIPLPAAGERAHLAR